MYSEKIKSICPVCNSFFHISKNFLSCKESFNFNCPINTCSLMYKDHKIESVTIDLNIEEIKGQLIEFDFINPVDYQQTA